MKHAQLNKKKTLVRGNGYKLNMGYIAHTVCATSYIFLCKPPGLLTKFIFIKI